MAYAKSEGYTYMQVRRLISTSEARASTFYAGATAHGHASAMHQSITDTTLTNRLSMLSTASAFKDTADTNFGAKPAKTEDQAFLMTEILNSKLGRAALQAFDLATAGGAIARLSIAYIVGNSTTFSLREARLVVPAGVSMNQAKMNVAKYGIIDHNTPMQQIMSVFDSGYPDLHVVTNFPGSDSDVATYGNYGGYSIQLQGAAVPVPVKWTL